MNWFEVLHTGLKKEDAIAFANAAHKRRSTTDTLIEALCGEEKTVSRKAAWVVSTLAERDRDWIKSYADIFINVIHNTKDFSVQREILKIFLLIPPPENAEGKLIDDCFRFLLNPESDTAVKYTSMRIIVNAAKKYPELNTELRECLLMVIPNVTPALQRQMKKIMAGIP